MATCNSTSPSSRWSPLFSAIRPATRILYMSGYPSETMIRSGELEKGAALLDKPFRKADLARKEGSTVFLIGSSERRVATAESIAADSAKLEDIEIL